MKKLFFFLCILLAAMPAAGAKQSEPDFRYPETVMKQAAEQMKKADKKKDYQNFIDGFIRYSIAKSHISQDYVPQIIHTTDSLAATMDDKRFQAVLYCLELKMLESFYNEKPYVYSSRTEMTDTVPGDIREWSNHNFIDRAVVLAENILAEKDILSKEKVDNFKTIINVPKEGKEFAPTLFDALAYETLEYLNGFKYMKNYIYPTQRLADSSFYIQVPKISDEKIINLQHAYFKALLTLHSNDIPAYIYAELNRLSMINWIAAYNNKDNGIVESQLEKLYQQFADSKYSTEILIRLLNDKDISEQWYKTAQEHVKRYADYPRINDVKNYINKCEEQSVDLTTKDWWLPSDSIRLDVTARNLNKFKVNIYRVTSQQPQYDKLSELGNPFYSQTFDIESNGIYTTDKKIQLPPLDLGYYLVIVKFTDKKGKTQTSDSRQAFTVSNLTTLFHEVNDEQRLYVVRADNGQPMANALLSFVENKNVVQKQRTNRYGYAVISKNANRYNGYATLGNDTVPFYFYTSPTREEYISGKIFTDLKVYRPGETVKFSAIMFHSGKKNVPAKEETVNITVTNPNGKKVAEMTMLTDAFGRVDSTFITSKDGISGYYNISIKNSNNRYIASSSIQVSEYKAPTFYISYDKERSNLATTDSVCLKGTVMTFSQFPIVNATISYSLNPQNFYWIENNNLDSTSGTTTTDAQGNWSILLPASIFNGSNWGVFQLELTATSENGETQTASETIRIGSKTILSMETKEKYLNEQPILFPIRAHNLNQEPMDVDCIYRVIAEKDTVATGTINTKNPVINLTSLKSGKYKLSLRIAGEKVQDNDIVRDIILYRNSDTLPPVETILWTTKEAVTCNEDNSFSLELGSTADNYFFYTIYNDEKVIVDSWQFKEKGFTNFNEKAEFSNDSKTYLQLTAVHNCEEETVLIELRPSAPRDTVSIKLETFRDNITPGSRETWKLRIADNKGKNYKGAVLANMYDAALNKIANNTWSLYLPKGFAPFTSRIASPRYSPFQFNIQASSAYKYLSSPDIIEPKLNFYGQLLFNSNINYIAYGANSMVKRTAASADMALVECLVADEESSTRSIELKTGAIQLEQKNSPYDYRDPDIKTAFFLPALVSNENGEVVISFDVPNRNTQWQFSAIAYTEDMKYDVINRLITANKPLMVQPNMPRFVRIGDTLTVKATVMNNTDTETTAKVRVEFFTPKDNKVISKTDVTLTLPAKGSDIIAFDMNIDEKYDYLGYRIKADNGTNSDGEQNIIAVLPSTTDVVEAEPFYMTAEQKSAKWGLPKFGQEGKITFEYCDNPVWYCVTALPSVISSSETASAYITNYYATVMADNIVRSNTQIAEAIKKWNETKEQKSNLQKNAELKTISLENTPWLNEAESETAMMGKLADLTDAATLEYRKQKALTSLKDLQNADGGFSWFKNSESSVYITQTVVDYFGRLKELGYFDNNVLAADILKKAVDYLDNQVIEDLKKAKEPEKLYGGYFDYLYIRMLHNDIPLPKELAPVKTKTLESVEKNWGNYSIPMKAEAAILLANCDKKKSAAAIVESLRQYTVKTDNRGIYWDVNGNKVNIAANALQAFNKVNPEDKDIDRIRLWLLQQKETQNWGTSANACDAIYAVLATGSSWVNSERKAPEIKVGNTKIETENADNYFGYIKRSFDYGTLKGNKLSVKRYGDNPAWGAVYCQYNAPMKEVQQQSATDIQVNKEFYLYDEAGKLIGKPANTFKVGDRVQVRVTVKTARDLDFVALTDDRAACFEPVDQLPVYSWKEGIRSYRETRNSTSNIFITRLTKGTYVMTYDVFVNNVGTYNSGIATVQCQYAPQIVSHSNGTVITAE